MTTNPKVSLRIQELEKLISYHRTKYYNGEPEISDTAFDALIDELAKLEPCNKVLLSFGAEPVSVWEKISHKHFMGSLNKCNNPQEFEKWAKDYCANGQFFATLKLDGLSISLIYEKGKLVQAVTRGGEEGIGENILTNVVKMKHVPLVLKEKIDAHVRGEILMAKADFESVKDKYSNARNAASGISRRLDGEESALLTVVCYQLVSDSIPLKTEEEQFNTLIAWGFMTPQFWKFKSIKEVIDFKEDFQKDGRDKYGFHLDGLVIRNNDLEIQNDFGISHNRPKAAVAYKFGNESCETTVESIDWQTGPTGRITPVANLAPVELAGAIIKRASLYNYTNCKNLGIDCGANVIVERAGDVIPAVVKVTTKTGSVISYPESCPVCGYESAFEGEYLICYNTGVCPAQVVGRLQNWITTLNIMEWGDKLLTRLVEDRKVFSVSQLYQLSIKDLASLERMGEKSAQNCYNTLWERNPISLELFLGGLSIPLIGVSSIKLLIDAGFDSLNKILSATPTDFEKVKGLGKKKAKNLHQGLRNNRAEIEDLLKAGVKIKEKTVGKLNGKSFCITGKTTRKRDDLKQMILDNGGIFKSNVGRDLNYLIMASEDSTSTKAQDAKKLGTIILSEDKLLEMIQ
jgi:DNA ligase (NAD+)